MENVGSFIGFKPFLAVSNQSVTEQSINHSCVVFAVWLIGMLEGQL